MQSIGNASGHRNRCEKTSPVAYPNDPVGEHGAKKGGSISTEDHCTCHGSRIWLHAAPLTACRIENWPFLNRPMVAQETSTLQKRARCDRRSWKAGTRGNHRHKLAPRSPSAHTFPGRSESLTEVPTVSVRCLNDFRVRMSLLGSGSSLEISPRNSFTLETSLAPQNAVRIRKTWLGQDYSHSMSELKICVYSSYR